MRILRLLLLTFLINCNAYATDPTLFLEKNAIAPFAGYLLSPDKAKAAADAVIEREGDELLIASYNRTLSLQATQIQNYQDKESFSDGNKLLWFGVGALSTILVAYGLQHTR